MTIINNLALHFLTKLCFSAFYMLVLFNFNYCILGKIIEVFMNKTHVPKKRPTLEEAQQMVGGYVEMVVNRPDLQLLVDEDGLSKDLDVNHEASFIANQRIVGSVVILKDKAMWD